LVARTLELTRFATVIKLTPDPYFMTLSFGGCAAPRERNDTRPALSRAPVHPADGAWSGFQLYDRTHIERVLAAVHLLKASPEATGKPVYVNVFAPLTVAMQCDPRLVERLRREEERPVVSQGLRVIAAATAKYISSLAAAGADGIFYSNKCLRSEMGSLVEEWALLLDAQALAPLRAAEGPEPASRLDMVLHACGSSIAYERILAAFDTGVVYPKDTVFSWNFEEGNPSLEQVLATTSLRVWGTYPRALLRGVGDASSGEALEAYLLHHKEWLQEEGCTHRVVVGPDCCPGALIGEEVPTAGWDAVNRAYEQYLGSAPHGGRGAAGGA
jgi:hypothetical protein